MIALIAEKPSVAKDIARIIGTVNFKIRKFRLEFF